MDGESKPVGTNRRKQERRASRCGMGEEGWEDVEEEETQSTG